MVPVSVRRSIVNLLFTNVSPPHGLLQGHISGKIAKTKRHKWSYQNSVNGLGIPMSDALARLTQKADRVPNQEKTKQDRRGGNKAAVNKCGKDLFRGAYSQIMPSAAQLRYLRRGLREPGGKLPIFDRDGRAVNRRVVESCIMHGWAEAWFRNPIKPDWLVCRLTSEGFRIARDLTPRPLPARRQKAGAI